ncbi:glycosyltransferase family 4 protein [Ectothiorhodospira shaposhnikovii]|uniref:glycosyltransferase family 4 protein n=1 Tax=Ectothiorhodospira shaposhnikovii TaxID=1054 RepID=UPI001EE87489|nr:glycosyltransferase family 4 protein [Ectothiorhodospira shaposhnikovii]MCG5512750.1 glycosyltransferase family 4 protein [Ectothiorhodospira shaposhnikovii]
MKILLFANTDWYLYNFRRSLAQALCDAGYEVLLVSPPGPYGEQLLSMGFRWVPAPMERLSLNPLREAALLWWLRRLLKAEKVDLVHGFTIKCAVYGSLGARLARLPARVNAVAGLGYVFISDSPKARLLRPVVRFLLRVALGGPRARLILQNCDDVALFLEARLVQEEQVRLIPGSGVDCGRFVPADWDAVGLRSGRLRVLLPARLLWDKGLAELVEAARWLRAAGRGVDVLLAGNPDPGNPASVPESVVRGWVAEGVLEWLGHVDDMPVLLRSVDVVVLPSYREGLPKGLIEAAACALPLVTTDVPGCREVVTHEVDGLLVPVKDGVALARAIARLQDDPGLRRRLGEAAREKALREFDERIVIERTLGVYGELVGNVAGKV